ncbi:MAG TPA: biotin/lipoyl-binding protein, partial [Gemmatimonadales bacterium]|nr:biotin/lipoyl-binding protein [Gemmatimonadales bacterium]
MTSPAQPDLSKLRINRDAPPPNLRRAVRRNLIFGLAALVLLLGVFRFWRGRSVVTVETVVATPLTAGGSGDNAGSSSVTANGYVVARTRAAVSAKLPGRIAELRVSEGSTLKKDEIIATLDNADYQAQLAQAQAALASARADLVESQASLATAARDAKRLREI